MTADVAPITKHPAPYSDSIIEFMGRRLREEQRAVGREIVVVDPFAGVGRIHRAAVPTKIRTIGIELEPPWAACHADTICGDSLTGRSWSTVRKMTGLRHVDAIATSPSYANRFSDSHDAKDASSRRSYTHDLASVGHTIDPNNTGTMPWGPRYRRFHADAYRVFFDRLREGGLFMLNVSGFIRQREVIDAPLFHLGAALAAGFVEVKPAVRIDTSRMTHGENRDRVDGEIVYQLRRP